ncbi:MAG: iron hydrogenase small subunit [Solidesulfovibrio sp.]
MSILAYTRRGFLKTACVLSGGALIGLRLTGKAVAAVKQLKEYMMDRIDSVYGADAKFKVRASQDNQQVITLYKKFLKEPLSHESEHLLHTTWVNRSRDLAALTAKGLYPNPRAKEFVGTTYPYE